MGLFAIALVSRRRRTLFPAHLRVWSLPSPALIPCLAFRRPVLVIDVCICSHRVSMSLNCRKFSYGSQVQHNAANAKMWSRKFLSFVELVGAPGFEPETSCAQGRRNISRKSFLFNLIFENKRVRKIFGSGTMCGNVAPHAQSPPNFPHSEITAKVFITCVGVESNTPSCAAATVMAAVLKELRRSP
jgi:hypothetical protein